MLPSPRSRLLLSALAIAGLSAAAGPARAIALVGDLAPGSSISQASSSAPLTGSVGLEVGALPPLAANTTLDVVSLVAFAAGLSITLDDGLANPGLGVLFTDGTFLIPSLHLSVDGIDLTASDVAGTFGPSAACGGGLCLETSFEIDPGSGGVVTVDVAALVPEPGVPLLGLGVIFAGAAVRRVRIPASRRGRA